MDFLTQNDLKITLKEKKKAYRIFIKDISYIQSNSYLCSVYFIDDRKSITVTKLLKEFEIELSKYGFLRISRNTLVNMLNIVVIHNDNTRRIFMNGGATLTISCRNYPKVNRILKK